MTLYEIVLRRPERDETRFTDHPPKVGSTLVIDNQPFLVEHVGESQHPIAQSRYICLPDDPAEQRS
jgi:hypothetical protein